MTILDLQNLWVGYNDKEDFRILICAGCKKEAKALAESYRKDSKLSGSFDIYEFTDVNTKFDCDYVIVAEDE